MRNRLNFCGYTLIELIVVIVVLAVLSVSIAPRFFTTAGTSEYLYQDQLLNLLRRVQIQAMQCTDCITPAVNVSAASVLIGAATCNDADTSAVVCVAARDAVTLAPAGTISFDNLGRPACSAGSCTITLQGQTTLNVCIASEGYIHPC
ncbi:prepilin-type N-terminal cleavage/methylation domain-containing protein [Rheinheimera sp.]|uniref:prepilin-type N-terminal cleavage/methylation domain-containing protein n=1 Tax=Rheinheimera sp. TaxID=1869214 RepID=UPI0027350BCE|nr:prepilin-type N-terminal cleavage/methylation domain-containing protein [Rheinheimera sp.]MDP2716752.1 prepilin-type N-terminal cleavage/methylation domain-containing protein [Rheinheimera sp.]